MTRRKYDNSQRECDHNENNLNDQYRISQRAVVFATIPKYVLRIQFGEVHLTTRDGQHFVKLIRINRATLVSRTRQAIEIAHVRVVFHALHEPKLLFQETAIVGV